MKTSNLGHYASQYTGTKPSCSLWRVMLYYRGWRESITGDYHPISARKPWINYPATEFISARLREGQSVFEYGAGGSTLFFLDHGLSVTSIEHDSAWFDKISKAVGKCKQRAAWKGLLCEPSLCLTDSDARDCADPDAYISSSRYHQKQNFRNYVQAIDQFYNKRFDWVIIDGRSRPSCVKHSLTKLKKGGFIMVDNTERSHYITARTLGYLANFRLVHDCYGPTAGLMNFTRTTVWQLPI